MKYLKLEYIKQHSRIDYDCEDALLELYGNSAETIVFAYLNRTYRDVIDEYGCIPAPILQATLMLVDASYQQRTPFTIQEARASLYGFNTLIKPYMRLASMDDVEVQTVSIGSDTKIEFTADLPNGLLLKDIDFKCVVVNADTNKQVEYEKRECIIVGDGRSYVVLVDTTEIGVGPIILTLTVQIPDTDYSSGYRREIINIDPNIRITA